MIFLHQDVWPLPSVLPDGVLGCSDIRRANATANVELGPSAPDPHRPSLRQFQNDPIYATSVVTGVIGTVKAHQTLSDPGLFLAMVSPFQRYFHPSINLALPVRLHSFTGSSVSERDIPVYHLLLPLFNHLWLSQGAGNTNSFCRQRWCSELQMERHRWTVCGRG